MATADSSVARTRLNVAKELAALEKLTAGELRARYATLFQETTRTHNRVWLIRRILWRMQALEEGGLSERAQQRAEELASTSNLRVTAPRERKATKRAAESTTQASQLQSPPDVPGQCGSRLPLPGTLLTRPYKGRLIQVRVLPDGFEYEGERFKTLSAVAKQVTGSHWNGFKFFNLDRKGGDE